MTTKKYALPAVAWLKVTDYMHGWMQWELGGEISVRGQRVICVQLLEGARDVLRMETTDDTLEPEMVVNAMSAKRRNCIEAGLTLDSKAVERLYGMTQEKLKLFVPIECPKNCLTRNGVLRPWTLNVCFGKEQARALQNLIREEFWSAVNSYDIQYARQQEGCKYPATNMIEAFCKATRTPDVYVAALRREWQRRKKRLGGQASV